MHVTGRLLLIILLYKHLVSAEWRIKTKRKVRIGNIISVEKDISLLSCQQKCNHQKDCYKIGRDEMIDLGMMGSCYFLRKTDCSESRLTSASTIIITKDMDVYEKHDLCKASRCRDDQKCVITGASYNCLCKNRFTTNDCEYLLSCDAIKQLHPEAPSGFYTINPSKPVSVFCDMDLDTNGWMLIANITLPNTISNEEAAKLSSLQSLSNKIEKLNQVSTGRFRFNPLHLADFDTSFHYIHFYCKKPGGRTISISTLNKNVLDFFMLKTDTKPYSCSSYKRLSEDTSIITSDCASWHLNRWYAPTRDGNGLYFPFFVNGKFHYAIFGTRYECDDYQGVNAGLWKIYVR